MVVNMTKDEHEFLESCVFNDKEMGMAKLLGFDTSKHDKMLSKLSMLTEGVETVAMPFIVEFTWDNGAVLEDMRVVCMAFDEDDARAIIHNKYSKRSDEFANIRSVRKFTDNDIVSERI